MAKAKKKSTTFQTKLVWVEVAAKDRRDLAAELAPLLARFWKRFQAGDNKALFDLVVWSLSIGEAPSAEASTEFINRYDLWNHGKVRTLDEAFQLQRPKGKHIGGRFPSYARLCPHIAVRAEELRRQGWPVDRHLFETLAKELGVGHTIVEKIFNTPECRIWRKVAAAGILRLGPATKAEIW